LAETINSIFPTGIPVKDKIDLVDNAEARLIRACKIMPLEQSDALVERLDQLTTNMERQSEELRKLRSEKARWTRSESVGGRNLAGVSMELVISQLKLLEFYEKESDEASASAAMNGLDEAATSYARLDLFGTAGYRWKGVGDALLNTREDGRLTTFEVNYLVRISAIEGLNVSELRRLLDRTKPNGKPKCIIRCGGDYHAEGCRNTDAKKATTVQWRLPKPSLR
jgi:hypothetical protein